jgi:hypothetical protein
MVAILTIMTGGRGRKKAKKFISITLGSAMAMGLALVPVGLRLGADFMNEAPYLAALTGGSGAMAPATGTTDTEPATPPADLAAAMAATDDTDAALTDAGTTDAVADAATADDPPDPPPEKPVAARGTTSRKSTSKSSGSKSSGSKSSGSSSSGSSSSGSSSSGSSSSGSSSSVDSSLPVSPPMVAIDTMVKNNVGVKKCFYYYQKDHGSLPSQVTVKFNIAGGGTASRIGVTESKPAGTELDSCLSKAIGKITFPPSQDGLDIKAFPFVFQ